MSNPSKLLRVVLSSMKGEILRDVSWFARAPVSEAKLLQAASFEEYIYKTRIAPIEEAFGGGGGDEADENKGNKEKKEEKETPYPLEQQLDLGEFIEIHFQIDRYSELEYWRRTYKASTPIIKTVSVKNEDWAEKLNEIQDKYGKVSWSWKTGEDHKEIRYTDGYTFSVGEILEHVYRFYSGEIPRDDLLEIVECDNNWEYADKAKEALKNGTVLYREEVMGDCMHFEGLEFIGFSKYGKDTKMFRIMFGS